MLNCVVQEWIAARSKSVSKDIQVWLIRINRQLLVVHLIRDGTYHIAMNIPKATYVHLVKVTLKQLF